MTPDYFKRRVQELLETTNRYLDRARNAEAMAAYYKDRMRQWKASFDRALTMSIKARKELYDACRQVAELEAKLSDLRAVHDRLCSRNDDLVARERELVAERRGLRQVRHKKRGSTYSVLGDLSFQLAKPENRVFGQYPYSHVREGDTIRVYRSEDDGKLYGRFISEFEDGRFEDIEAVKPEGDNNG
jgi:hypothetical protein